MNDKIRRQHYAATGRCTICGKEQAGEELTKKRCLACLAKARTGTQKYRAKLKAEGLCRVCGKVRPAGRGGTPTQCGACARQSRARGLAYLQKKRNQAAGYVEGDGRNMKKWPVGAASTAKRDDGVYNFKLVLDRDSLEAIQVIKKRYRDGEWKAGRDPQTHQLSRLVREVILKYEPNRAVVKPRKHRLRVEMKANLSLDGRTKAILTRQAALSFNGNKSAALRAMLIECQGFRKAFTVRMAKPRYF